MTESTLVRPREHPAVRAARLVLAGLLLLTAVAKLFPAREGTLLGPVLAPIVACAELALVCGLLFVPSRILPSLLVVGLAIGGAFVAMFSSVPCGCTGPVILSPMMQFQLCMTIGFLACVVIWSRLGQGVPKFSQGSLDSGG